MPRTTEQLQKDAEELLIIEKIFQLECPFDNRMATPDMEKYGNLLRTLSMAKRLLKENKELSAKLREREWQPIENYDKDEPWFAEFIRDDPYYPEIRSWCKARDTWVDFPDCDVNHGFDERDHYKYFRNIMPPTQPKKET